MKLKVTPSETRHPYRNSCTAGVLQSLYQFYIGKPLSIRKAVKLMNCEADGAEFDPYYEILGMKRMKVHSMAGIRWALSRGFPVVAAEEKLHGGPHAILIIGFTAKGFYFMDPALGKIRWRSEDWVWKNGCEYQCLIGTPIQPTIWQRVKRFFV